MTCKSKEKTFEEKFKRLLAIDDSIYGLHSTYEDPISGKIKDVDREEVVIKSTEVGKKLAQKTMLENPRMSVEELIHANDVELVIKEEAEDTEFVYFGTYDSDGPITLFTGNIEKSEALLKAKKIDWLSIEEVHEIVLAHELFHYYEDVYPELYTNIKEIKLWKLGPYTHYSKLICPGEIAAMAFTKELLALDFNPEAINYLLYTSIDPKKGEAFYNNICSLDSKSRV